MKVFSKDPKSITRVCLGLVLILNIGLWFSVRHVQARWDNVPPAPEKEYGASYGLGDPQFAYRTVGLMIQNLGDYGGRVTSLNDYDYNALARWFFLADHLDPKSNFVPALAAYYFGAVQTPEKFYPVLPYLEKVGQRPEGKKWRFLAHAIYFLRFRLQDHDKALVLAYKLSNMDNPNIPNWTRYIPMLIMKGQGNTQGAYDFMIEIMRSSADDMEPNEFNYLRGVVCEEILTPEKAALDPLCKNEP